MIPFMAQSKNKDENGMLQEVTVLTIVSYGDGSVPMVVYADETGEVRYVNVAWFAAHYVFCNHLPHQ
jgi:hypothetical protein